jgi:hypothetical protein
VSGCGCGNRGRAAFGVGLFVDEEGFTTVAAAVAVLVSLALVFGMANLEWTAARSADVQAVADAGALAGMNAVASYVTAAQVVDAVTLSLGLVGMLTLAVGLVLCAMPVTATAGPPVIEAASKVLDARTSFARSAASGLASLEEALPFLVAADALATVRANGGDEVGYVGVALPFPLEGESDFGSWEEEPSNAARDVSDLADRMDELSQQAEQAAQKVDAAKERAWLADCGGDVCMRERASALAGLSSLENPSYPQSSLWDFGVAIRRARSYYAARLSGDVCEDDSVEAHTRHAARVAFYGLALELTNASSFQRNADGTVTCDLKELPRNTETVRQTRLYTDAVWPATDEGGVRTIHSYAGCPGARGASAGLASVADEEAGRCARCATCQFSVADLGLVASPTTNTAVGFEYYWKQVVEASRDYQEAADEQAAVEGESLGSASKSAQIFQDALEALSVTRVTLKPPGRYGCVCVVADPSGSSEPAALSVPWASGIELPVRVAISAAALVEEDDTFQNNVLADFFDDLVEQGGFVGGVSTVLDGVLTVWGDVLVAYGDLHERLTSVWSGSVSGLRAFGLGTVASWLEGTLGSVVSLAGLQPTDMSAKKPVLVNSADVAERMGNGWYSVTRSMLTTVSLLGEGAGVSEVLAAVGAGVQTLTASQTLTVAELTVPGTSLSIPIEIDLGWLADLEAA